MDGEFSAWLDIPYHRCKLNAHIQGRLYNVMKWLLEDEMNMKIVTQECSPYALTARRNQCSV